MSWSIGLFFSVEYMHSSHIHTHSRCVVCIPRPTPYDLEIYLLRIKSLHHFRFETGKIPVSFPWYNIPWATIKSDTNVLLEWRWEEQIADWIAIDLAMQCIWYERILWCIICLRLYCMRCLLDLFIWANIRNNRYVCPASTESNRKRKWNLCSLTANRKSHLWHMNHILQHLIYFSHLICCFVVWQPLTLHRVACSFRTTFTWDYCNSFQFINSIWAKMYCEFRWYVHRCLSTKCERTSQSSEMIFIQFSLQVKAYFHFESKPISISICSVGENIFIRFLWTPGKESSLFSIQS